MLAEHGGFFKKGRFDLFRSLATSLLDSVAAVHERGYALRALSPATLFLDGAALRILVLPTMHALASDQAQGRSDAGADKVDAVVMSEYAAHASGHAAQLACLPNWGAQTEQSGVAADMWAVGMCLFTMAFGRPLTAPDSVNARNPTPAGSTVGAGAASAQAAGCHLLAQLVQNAASQRAAARAGAGSPAGNHGPAAIARSMQQLRRGG